MELKMFVCFFKLITWRLPSDGKGITRGNLQKNCIFHNELKGSTLFPQDRRDSLARPPAALRSVYSGCRAAKVNAALGVPLNDWCNIMCTETEYYIVVLLTRTQMDRKKVFFFLFFWGWWDVTVMLWFELWRSDTSAGLFNFSHEIIMDFGD